MSNTFQTIAAAIIAAIPGALSAPINDNGFTDDWHNFTVGNAMICLRRHSWKADKNAINVNGYSIRSLADHKPYGTVWPECKVSMKRPAADIAADIQRKIIAPLQPIIAASIERKAVADNAAQQLASHIERIAAISPDIRIDASGRLYASGISGDIKADGSIYVTRLSHGDAAGLLKFLFDKPA